MDVAISGDRGSCLTQQLAPGTYLFGVAHGFGQVEGDAIAHVVLARLRSDFERRGRGDRLRKAQRRPKAITHALSSAFGRVNEEIHGRTASHDDYVTAGCSLTAALLIDDRAYLAHVGSSAAYLSRDGYVVSLTKNDAFDGSTLPVLVRAIGAAPSLEVSLCTFTLNDGDALVLAGRRLREVDERRRLTECLSVEGLQNADQMLVVRYAGAEPSQVCPRAESHTLRSVLTGVLATMLFYAMLCIR